MINTENIKEYAIKAHTDTNHKYADIYDYSFHLQQVAEVAENFSYLLEEKERAIVIGSAWCHDLLEDARQSYNDVKKVAGTDVAEIVFLCTSFRGRTRDERMNDKFYEELKTNKLAVYVKICDRIANVKYSLSSGSSMFKKYKKENVKFKEKLYTSEFDSMFKYLDALFIE